MKAVSRFRAAGGTVDHLAPAAPGALRRALRAALEAAASAGARLAGGETAPSARCFGMGVFSQFFVGILGKPRV